MRWVMCPEVADIVFPSDPVGGTFLLWDWHMRSPNSAHNYEDSHRGVRQAGWHTLTPTSRLRRAPAKPTLFQRVRIPPGHFRSGR